MIKELILAKNLNDLYILLEGKFDIIIKEIFIILYEKIKRNEFEDAKVIIDNLSKIICNDENLSDIDYILNKVIDINTKLTSIKVIKEDRRFYDIKFRISCLIPILSLKRKELSNDYRNKYKHIEKLVFVEKDELKIDEYLRDDPDILKLEFANNNIFTSIINHYLLIDKNNCEEIEYYKKIIDKFLTLDNYCVLLNNKNKYYKLLNNSQYINKKHIREVIAKLDNYYQADIEQIKEKYNIHFNFNHDVEKEALSLIPNSKNRINYLYQNPITIDDDNTECFDDALYLRKNKDGGYTLYIHILDIPSIVPFRSLIDLEANRRVETLYLCDKSVSLYPNKIINNHCSLVLGVQRNVLSYIIDIDSNYNILEDTFRIKPGIIKVKNRLTYDEVDRIYNGSMGLELDIMIEKLGLIAMKLKNINNRKENYRRIENVVTKESFNSVFVEKSIAHNITQESMILVNYLIANFMRKKSLPYFYRSHSPFINTDEMIDFIDNNPALLTNKKNAEMIKKLYLNAFYSSVPLPHKGLELPVYSHSTSPGRRYVDAAGQYLEYDLLLKQQLEDKDVYRWEGLVTKICDYVNDRNNENRNFQSFYNSKEYKKLVRKK